MRYTEERQVQGSSVADLDPDPEDPYALGLLNPDPDPLVRGTDPAPDPSLIKQKY